MSHEFVSGNGTLKGIGTSFVEVHASPSLKKSLLIALALANLDSSAIFATVQINESTNGPLVVQNVLIPVGSSLQLDLKVLLNADDVVDVKCSKAASMDAVVTVIEDVN